MNPNDNLRDSPSKSPPQVCFKSTQPLLYFEKDYTQI